MTRAALSANGKGFNRTFMELKEAVTNCVIKKVRGFNRTFMELKGRGPPCMMIE